MGCCQRSCHGAAELAKEKTQDLQQCRTCLTFSLTVQHLGQLCVVFRFVFFNKQYELN